MRQHRVLVRRRPGFVLPIVAAFGLAACGGDTGAGAPRGGGIAGARAGLPCAADTMTVGDDASPTARTGLTAVQLGAFADSARAAALRDSLAGAGWAAAYVHDGWREPAADRAPARWRVRLVASTDSLLPRLVAHQLRLDGRGVTLAAVSWGGDTSPHALAGMHPRAIPVNRGTHGMSARVRWVRSPDECTLLVVEDPVAVEAEPVTNGFVFAREGDGLVVRRDSVWDVRPSPDWSRLAFARGWVLSAREADSLPTAAWTALATRTGMPAATLRAGSFSASGMAYARGVAIPAVVTLAPHGAVERVLPIAGGWRVRWTRDGRAVALGVAPKGSQDDVPPTAWRIVDVGSRPARSASERARSLASDVERDSVAWTPGPTLDIGMPPGLTDASVLVVGPVRVESRAGWIRLTRPDAAARAVTQVVGPGRALVSTAGGRFIVALVPVLDADSSDQPARLVVYELP